MANYEIEFFGIKVLTQIKKAGILVYVVAKGGDKTATKTNEIKY